jgi:hypothetical protein
LTLWVAWLTACLTPGEIAYANSVAAIPTTAIATTSRARLDSPSDGVGRALKGEIDMPSVNLSSREADHGRSHGR